MKQNKIAMKTMAIKARVANLLRTEFYQYVEDKYASYNKNKKPLSNLNKEEFVNNLFEAVKQMNLELKNYKRKRQDKIKLYEKRLNSPQTKSMKKKLGLIPKISKINLVESNK